MPAKEKTVEEEILFFPEIIGVDAPLGCPGVHPFE